MDCTKLILVESLWKSWSFIAQVQFTLLKKNNLPKNCMKCAAELAELAEQSALAAAVCGFDPAIEDSALNIRYFMYTVVQIIILE